MPQQKKYTMQDIADEVGVSKATVSYVLNNKTGKKISEETRRKILQVANLYQYKPNISAKSLSTTQLKQVGLMLPVASTSFYGADYFLFIQKLSLTLQHHGYDLNLIPSVDLACYTSLAYDFIIALDCKDEMSDAIGHVIYTPLILINSRKQSELFHAIYFDYVTAIEQIKETLSSDEHPIVIMEPFNNTQLNDWIKQACEVYEYQTPAHLANTLQTVGTRPLITIGESLALVVQNLAPHHKQHVITHNPATLLNPNTLVLNFSMDQKVDYLITVISHLANAKSEKLMTHEHLLSYEHKNF